MENSRAGAKQNKIVIVGGGICGLTTALALHRKGVDSVVIEKSETLRATGAAIIIQPNGWRALEKLGVASRLKHKTVPVYKGLYIGLDSGEYKEMPMSAEGTRCIRRAELLQALAKDIPPQSIKFGLKMRTIQLDPFNSCPNILLDGGTTLQAKVVIGCDGINSAVGKFLGMNSTRVFSTCAIRGVTRCSSGNYQYHNKFLVISKGSVQLGRMPIDDNFLYWFITRPRTSQDSIICNDQKLIKQATIESLSGFPEEEVELIRNSDLDHLHLTPISYRAPWDLVITKRLRQGTVTMAGDAMHGMGPFIAQGGSSSFEDAIVFTRCFTKMTYGINPVAREWMTSAQMAIEQYVKARKMRVLRITTQAFLIGTMLDSSRGIVKFICSVLMAILSIDGHNHTVYDCGQL